MATSSDSSVSLEETDTQHGEMHSTIEAWIDDLVDHIDDAQASEEFQEWLGVQNRFHDYSHRNTLLIELQYPEVTRVTGYNTWRNDFKRHVQEGKQTIWVWAPIITKRCPEYENSINYHENIGCGYDETPQDEWPKGLVGFKLTLIFDASQMGGEPLPELETAATGDASDLVPTLKGVADELGVTVHIVDADDWEHGDAKGVCKYRNLHDFQPVVEARARSNHADLTVTLIHEYAHALLHFGVEDEPERAKHEVETGAVVYIVGRYLGLDTSGSAFYLTTWQGDDPEVIQERLGRISSTVQGIIRSLGEWRFG